MVRETSGSDDWLESLVTAAHGRELKEALDAVSCHIERALGARVWFVKMLGRRWSFFAGTMNPEPSSSRIERIKLNDEFGLVSDNWEVLSGPRGTDLVMFLKWLVSTRTEKQRVHFENSR